MEPLATGARVRSRASPELEQADFVARRWRVRQSECRSRLDLPHLDRRMSFSTSSKSERGNQRAAELMQETRSRSDGPSRSMRRSLRTSRRRSTSSSRLRSRSTSPPGTFRTGTRTDRLRASRRRSSGMRETSWRRRGPSPRSRHVRRCNRELACSRAVAVMSQQRESQDSLQRHMTRKSEGVSGS